MTDTVVPEPAPEGATDQGYRVEHDSMGDVLVPAAAKWQAQTQRAVENFPVSGLRIERSLVRAIALLKGAAARENAKLGVIGPEVAGAIAEAASEVAEGKWDAQFPIDVFQTGSGTSSNMNMNEVLATLAGERLGQRVHPNDEVNASQSSNDTFPSAIHLAAVEGVTGSLIPSLAHLAEGHGYGVHEMGPAGLDDLGELGGLATERRREMLERRREVVEGRLCGRDAQGARERVVARLAVVDVVVGMDVETAGEVCETGHDLVDIHVRRRAGAGLEDVDGELVVVPTHGDLASRGGDGRGAVGVKGAELGVDLGCCGLELRQCVDHAPGDRLPADREVRDGSGGLRTPQRLCRHLHLAHRVVLRARCDVIHGPILLLPPKRSTQG